MCGLAAIPIAAMMIGGQIVGQMLAPNPPSVQMPGAPAAPPQAAKTPDQSASRAATRQGQAGGGSGAMSTMLTGASGVDPSLLNLGKNTLLGA